MSSSPKDDLVNKLRIECSDLGLGDTNHENCSNSVKGHTDGSCIRFFLIYLLFFAVVVRICWYLFFRSVNLSGSKRVRQVNDEQTSVQVIFKRLSRKSKNKLEELLHQWCEWHAQECSPSEGQEEDFVSGEEIYFPVLIVGKDNPCSISVYMDNQVNKRQRTDDALINKHAVPIYDRGTEFALLSGDELANKESSPDLLNASRCFNCDAYDHSLKECPKPYNKVVVNNARRMYLLKNKRPAAPRVLTRYYQHSPGGKFDGLKPGCLGPEARKLLGLGEFDPPPWLNRMREIGYPPGYLDLEDEDQPSGIIIYANANGDTKEDEKCVSTNPTQPDRKMSVSFPGINAPIPTKADKKRWAANHSKPTSFEPHSNNSALNHRVPISPNLLSTGQSYNSNLQPECRREFSPSISNHASSYEYYPPGIPFLSNYANNYLNTISQHYQYYSYNAYQK
ncbi:uncharacterized protein [Rutidosis leptorrhynchoides]|uniref:uncharacterized protein n=1 Tax=Rutidosis leptorrhynchoides TaxID=125765 RepID=UPI003A9996F6